MFITVDLFKDFDESFESAGCSEARAKCFASLKIGVELRQEHLMDS